MKSKTAHTAFKIPEKTVHLWHCRFDRNLSLIPTFQALLSNDELQKAERFKFLRHRQHYIIGRGVLRSLLSAYLNTNPERLEFGYTEYEKPFLKQETRLRFNLSHSHNRAVFAFVENIKIERDTEIGVDIEKIKDDFDFMEVGRHFFSKDEIAALQNAPKSQRAIYFYRCWTRKEAFIKAKGNGLSFPLDAFSVSLDANSPVLLRTNWNTSERTEWRLFTFKWPSVQHKDAYVGALAARADIHTVEHREWKEAVTTMRDM